MGGVNPSYTPVIGGVNPGYLPYGTSTVGTSYIPMGHNVMNVGMTTTIPVVTAPIGGRVQFAGIIGCHKCGGTGWKYSKKKHHKSKPCKKCMLAKGYCANCGNSGFKYKNGKPCKCKFKLFGGNCGSLSHTIKKIFH